MPTIKVRDLAWARLRAPDLDAMEEFLTHFGLIRAARTPTALYMRGTDPPHHIHVTEKASDAGFVGFAYHAASEEDLARVATLPGASAVEPIDEPGGGRRVRLREPNGYQIEVVWGVEALPEIPVSIDGRTNLHGDARISRSVDTWLGKGWESDPELAQSRLVISHPKNVLASLLRADKRFRLVYEDNTALVFVATGS